MTEKVTHADLILIIGDQYVTICALRSEIQRLTKQHLAKDA